MTRPIPFAPGAVRLFLIAQPDILALLPAASITTRDVPDPITGPYATIRAVGGAGDDPMQWNPLVQVDAWVPPLEVTRGTTDPEELAWDIVATAGQRIGRARAQEFRGAGWSGHWKTGIITAVDKTRGVDQPIYRATIRAEIRMRAPRSS